MINLHKYLLITCLCGFCFGCTGPELTKRYHSTLPVSIEDLDAKYDQVKVSTFVTTVSEEAPPAAITQLSERGQMALVQAVAKSASKDDLFRQLGGKLGRKESSSRTIERTSGKFRLVSSVAYFPKKLGQADRIIDLKLHISLGKSPIIYSTWNKFTTEYGTAQLGKIGIEKTLGVSASVSPTFTGWLVGSGDATATASRKTAEEVTLTQRYITVSGIIDDQELIIIQEGAVGIDLTGNSTADITYLFPPHHCKTEKVIVFNSLRDSKGASSKQAKVSYNIIDLKMPSLEALAPFISTGIPAYVSGSYTLRHVVSGADTLIEGDDDVKFITRHLRQDDKKITLISPPEIHKLRARYIIHPLQKEDAWLAIDHPPISSQMPMLFASYDEADEFLDWLKTVKSTKVANKHLRIDERNLVPRDIDSLRIGELQ